MGLKLNMEEFRAAFQRLRDGAGDTCAKAVREHMLLDVLPATQARVPKLTGALVGTARVEAGRTPYETSVWYGDSATENDLAVDYAAAVHEILEKKHAPPTSAKYVEEPLHESVPRLIERAGHELQDLADG